MIKNNSGAVYPIVLLLTSVTLIILYEITETYLSRWGYMQEIKAYYRNEITILLSEDVSTNEIDYNNISNEEIGRGE